MAKFYDQEADEEGSYEPQHIASEKAGPAKDLQHGPACDRCNDAKLNDMESNRRRAGTFHQTVNNLKSRRTDRAIDTLSAVMKRKSGGLGPEDNPKVFS
jgi:hypothetical protein